MYNLVWQSVTCWPGKLRILLSLKNRNAEPAAPIARDDVASHCGYPGEKRAAPVGCLRSGYALPPAAHRLILIDAGVSS